MGHFGMGNIDKLNCSSYTLKCVWMIAQECSPGNPAAAAAKSRQSCPTLCDPMDGSPPGSPVPGTLQARTLSGLPFPSPMHESEK